MSRTHGAGTYRILLADNRLRRTFALAMLGRLGYAVLPLSFMFTAAETSGSFRTGAAAIGIFGFAGLLMPFQARLMDARSQRAVLPAFGSMFLAAMTVALVMAATHVDSPIAWFAVALFGGASAPSLGPAMRAQWRAATTEADLPTAYSLDSVAEESAFLAGPVIAAGMLALGPAWHGALLAAMLIPVGVIGLALSPWASIRREAEDGPRRGILGPLRRGRFRVLLVVMAVGGFAGSLHLTSVAGLADLSGMPAVTGLVEAGCGVLAVLGGLWWGKLARASTWAFDLASVSLTRGLLLLACGLAPSLGVVSAALIASGVLLSPWFVSAFTAGDRLSDPTQHTEASTWVTTGMNIGSSLGAGSAGWAVAGGHLSVLFPVTVVALVGAAALCPLLTTQQDGGRTGWMRA